MLGKVVTDSYRYDKWCGTNVTYTAAYLTNKLEFELKDQGYSCWPFKFVKVCNISSYVYSYSYIIVCSWYINVAEFYDHSYIMRMRTNWVVLNIVPLSLTCSDVKVIILCK